MQFSLKSAQERVKSHIFRFFQARMRTDSISNSVAWLNGLKTEAITTGENLCYFRSAILHDLKGFLCFITFIVKYGKGSLHYRGSVLAME